MSKPTETRTLTFIALLRTCVIESALLSDAQLRALADSPSPVNPYDVGEGYPDRYREHAAIKAFRHVLAARGTLDWHVIQAEAQALLAKSNENQGRRRREEEYTRNLHLLEGLIKDVQRISPSLWSGRSMEQIQEHGLYEGEGLKLDVNDLRAGNLYAGLSVLARDMHIYLTDHPRSDSAVFQDVIAEVSRDDSRWHPTGAFPVYEGRPIESLPLGLAEAAANGKPTVKALDDPKIVHEWTVKPGKKLFNAFLRKFGSKFKETICGKNGPYQQFEKRNVNLTGLPTAIVLDVLRHGYSNDTLWYPAAVYLSILLIRTGLKTYCESEKKLIRRRRKST